MILDDLQKIKQIKKEIYDSIKGKGVDISSKELFELYPSQVDKIETAGPAVEKPYFDFYRIPPEPKNFVFGGGVSSEMGDIYFGFEAKLFDGIQDTPIKIGTASWGYKGLDTVDKSYLNAPDADIPTFSFVRAQPTCTDQVFGPTDLSADPNV